MINSIKNSLTLFTLITIGVGVLFVQTATAKTVVRSGDTVSIAQEQSIEGDFYTAAGKVNVSGSVTEDMIAAGGQVTLNGSVGEDVFIVAGSVDVHGPVGDDLRILAGEVTIAEPIAGDLFVIGGTVHILSTASIAGDVLIYAGQATIEGAVAGDILGNIDTLRIDTTVGGNVDVTVGQLTLGDRLNVSGSVSYVSRELAIQSLSSTIGGEFIRNDPVLPGNDMDIRSALIPVLVLLFSVLIWYLISKQTLNKVVNRALIKSPRPFLLGFATIMFAPLAIVLLSVSVIGTIVGLAGLFGYLLLATLSMIGVAAVLGQLMMRMFNHPTSHTSLMTLAVGVVGVSLLMLLPIIGQVILIIFALITLGSLVDLLIRPNLK